MSKIYTKKYEKNDFTLKYPQCFENLKGKGYSFESLKSNDLQPLVYFLKHNMATETAAVINVQTHGKDDKARFKKAKNAYELLKK